MSKVLLADDHDLIRATVSSLIRAAGDHVVYEAGGLDEALRKIKTDGPFDLVLLDFMMPGMSLPDGLNDAIAANHPNPVAILSGTATQEVARRALMLGAQGFMSKSMAPSELIAAINQILAGKTYASEAEINENTPIPGGMHLTPREVDVLRGICYGRSNKEIARDLEIQEVTIKLHVKTLSRKLSARNRTHAAMIARDMNLI